VTPERTLEALAAALVRLLERRLQVAAEAEKRRAKRERRDGTA